MQSSRVMLSTSSACLPKSQSVYLSPCIVLSLLMRCVYPCVMLLLVYVSFQASCLSLLSVLAPGRSQNVRDQGPATEQAVRELVSESTAMLQRRQAPAGPLQQPLNQPQSQTQQQPAASQQGAPHMLQVQASQVSPLPQLLGNH